MTNLPSSSPHPQVRCFALVLGFSLLTSCTSNPGNNATSSPSESDRPQVTILGSITGDGIPQLDQVFAPLSLGLVDYPKI